MKLIVATLLAAIATAAGGCTETTTVYGIWREGDLVAGACRPFLWDTDAHIEIFDTQHRIANDDVDCDELNFSLEIPIDVTHIRVTATDPRGSHWEKELDVTDGFVDVGVILFSQDTQPD